jgi:hypothetical protein
MTIAWEWEVEDERWRLLFHQAIPSQLEYVIEFQAVADDSDSIVLSNLDEVDVREEDHYVNVILTFSSVVRVLAHPVFHGRSVAFPFQSTWTLDFHRIDEDVEQRCRYYLSLTVHRTI